ncbi:hypothetical protein BO94DRAFT_627802 [Aspergillus sclerotioniger CBS 115572]|uniref:Uncharacterized protein n=1 Tax=Aspergillus sclerotioniger CBS 115572 TaxID=1450535 RepID=A0A317VH69_9EURO|nr:hypothetical protein BO94DRAFT_627802 [Aspergillus sclerotioniger CBS 115572]PWY72511.1 hypothetical protein BO94DRAFT_627802 [Aspergillus sclerotioniger CBS 115572]
MLFRHLPLLRARIPSSTIIHNRRTLASSAPRWNANESSAYREGMARYKLFVGPFAKVFLGAIFTYQMLYWTWLKLEMNESKYEKNQEVAALEQKAKELTGAQK